MIVAQGRKCVWLGDESYVYDSNNYLVLSAPMPMECQTTASEEEPLLEEQVISPDERVVCILTGHELKDPNVTVKYHTGIDMKAAQDTAPRVPTTGNEKRRVR